MKLHPASLGQEETSNSSVSRWSQSDCHCWEVPFGKCASVQLMLFVVCVCHFLTKGARVERGEKNPKTPGWPQGRESKQQSKERNKWPSLDLHKTKSFLQCVSSWWLPKGQAYGKKNPRYVHCTFINHKTFTVKRCQSNLINRENALMYSETWKPPIISPTCCFPTFSALSHLAVTAAFLVSLTSVFISLICFLVYLAWLQRGRKASHNPGKTAFFKLSWAGSMKKIIKKISVGQ